MSDMTWQDLRDTDFKALETLGESWRSYAEAMADRAQTLRSQVVDGHISADNYQSDTAELVREQIKLTADRWEDDLSDYATTRIATTLTEAHASLTAEQDELDELIPLIESHDFEIEGDPHGYDVNLSGGLHQAILTLDPPQWLCDRVGIAKPDGLFDFDRVKALFNGIDLYGEAMGLAGQYQDWLQSVMSRAHDADDEAAAALSQMRQSPPELPPKFGQTYDDRLEDYKEDLSEEVASEMEAIANGESGMSPEQVNQWWENLSESEREALIDEHPEWVGPTDGIPVEARDTANRAVLDDDIENLDGEISSIEQELARMEADGTDTVTGRGGQETSERYEELQERLADLEQDRDDLTGLREQIDGPNDDTGQEYYLLGFDTENSGQAVVSIGDPDTADNVNTYVPGTGSDLSGASGGLMDRTRQMAFDAQDAAPGESTATVMWLGYDAPQSVITDAPFSSFAEDGADDLESFTEGVRATAEGEPSNLTLTGHSYGTTVVGTAAADEGVEADNLVFAASPGTGVDTASALGVDEDNVWATRNDKDVIRYGMLHGTDPTTEEFGGNTFTSDAPRSGERWWEFWGDEVDNHSSYWDQENEISRNNMAYVATGQENAVR